jgi:DNA-3-methyladenine glycosylase II
VALLRIPEPYSFELSTERYRAFGADLANLWHEGGLHRVVGGREVRIEAAPGGVDVEPLDAETEPVVRTLLGLGFDLDAFAGFAAGDDVLGPVVVRLAGLRPSIAPDPLEALISAITAQQVSLFAAFAVRNRLVEAYAEPAGHAYAFPTAERLAAADEADLVALGFSRRKAEYVLGLARAGPDWAELARLPDDEVKRRITSIRGLGEWTADWFLARHLARPRGWPAGDLGLRKAVSAFYADGRMLSIDETRALGARFEPFQNLTAHYLLVAQRVPAPHSSPAAARAGRSPAPPPPAAEERGEG